MCDSIKFEERSEEDAFLHAAGHPTSDVFGVFIGSFDGEACRVVEALPLVHSECVGTGAATAVSYVEAYVDSLREARGEKGLECVGLYWFPTLDGVSTEAGGFDARHLNLAALYNPLRRRAEANPTTAGNTPKFLLFLGSVVAGKTAGWLVSSKIERLPTKIVTEGWMKLELSSDTRKSISQKTISPDTSPESQCSKHEYGFDLEYALTSPYAGTVTATENL